MHDTIDIHLVGASGAIGTRIDAIARADDRFTIASRISRAAPHAIARDRPMEKREIIVDFSHFSAIDESTRLARHRRIPLLVGTTALERGHLDALASLARDVPVLVAPNTSVGCVVLIQMVQKIARALGENFFPSIVEWHRSGKADAPSGTARALQNEIERASQGPSKFGPQGVASVRAAGIVGEHQVRFDALDETIELTHKAHSRDLFARGALRAAAWLVDQKPGAYDMSHVLGLAPEGQQQA